MKEAFRLLGLAAMLFAGSAILPGPWDRPASADSTVGEADTDSPGADRPLEVARIFQAHRLSLQVVSGMLTSSAGIGPRTPTLNYSQTNIRLGWMLNDPFRIIGGLRGNLEAIVDVSSSYVTNGFGSTIVGGGVLLRYNLVVPQWEFVPYVQAGGGIVYTDAYKDLSQEAIGQSLEFTPQASIGVHCRAGASWAIDVEAMYHHISNANLAARNLGINAVGGFIGLTWFF